MSNSIVVTGLVLGSVIAYRLVVSPLVRWAARRLGAGGYPGRSINGAYPDKPVSARNTAAVLAVVALLTGVAAIGYRGHVSGVYCIPATATALVLWKYVTADFDVARNLGWQGADRIVVLAVGIVGVCFPAASLAAIIALCGRLGGWTHHSAAALRLVKASSSWLLVLGLGTIGQTVISRPVTRGISQQDATAALFLLLGTVYLSHYVKAAASKATLSDKPWDWFIQNRTENLIGVAYAWGWARFLPARTVAWVGHRIRPLVPLLNLGTMLLECAGFIAFTSRWAFVAAVAAAVIFNAIVALLAGLLFWENMLLGGVFVAIGASHAPIAPPNAFGVIPWLLSVVTLGSVLLGWAWQPTGLGWWDTPLVSRVYWVVRTSSGKRYGLYNNLMSPHEREFGRALGYPLSDLGIVTFPLGGVEDARIRDALLALTPDLPSLNQVKRQFGHCLKDDKFLSAHVSYMQQFFSRLNAGTRKSPLPYPIRWLKAPGGHLYYWGDLPPYRARRESAAVVEVWHKELLYSSSLRDWFPLSDSLLLEIEIQDTKTHLSTPHMQAVGSRPARRDIPGEQNAGRVG
jgi:hypothetical protein